MSLSICMVDSNDSKLSRGMESDNLGRGAEGEGSGGETWSLIWEEGWEIREKGGKGG